MWWSYFRINKINLLNELSKEDEEEEIGKVSPLFGLVHIHLILGLSS